MTDNDYGTPLGVGTLHYETDAPTPAPVPREYTVIRLRIGAHRTHYSVSIPSVSGNPVNVGYHRKSENIGCSACHTANLCVHASALKDHLASNPLPSVA